MPGEFTTRQVRMDRETRQKVERGFRKGVLKTNVANIEKIMNRTVHNGKVYTGEAGKALKKRKLEKQQYYERNRNR